MDYFINEGFEKAINDYINSKDHTGGLMFNSFPVVVIRALVSIYGEFDILGSYSANDELMLHSNMLKYKFSKMRLNKFFSDMQGFYVNETNGVVPNVYFVSIQKFLIDMYMAKKVNYNVTTQDKENLMSFLYSPNSSNPLMISYNFMHSKDNFEVISYFDTQDKLNVKIQIEEAKVLLAPEAYRVVNKNYTDICLLSAEDVKKINDEVYSGLNVDKSSVNFEYLYDLALYNFYNKNKKITSGNGYVDILLIMGIISTALMTLAVLMFIVL